MKFHNSSGLSFKFQDYFRLCWFCFMFFFSSYMQTILPQFRREEVQVQTDQKVISFFFQVLVLGSILLLFFMFSCISYIFCQCHITIFSYQKKSKLNAISFDMSQDHLPSYSQMDYKRHLFHKNTCMNKNKALIPLKYSFKGQIRFLYQS